jgi:8-oxo-dGTP pyrophosphatase MutT (NUDIX family)
MGEKADVSGKQLTGAIGIIRNPDDGVSLLVSRRKAANDQYQLCGGGIKFMEHPVQALRREVREETGMELGDVDERPVVASLELDGNHIIALHFECVTTSAEIPPNPEPDLSSDWEWMLPEELAIKPVYGGLRELFDMGYFE